MLRLRRILTLLGLVLLVTTFVALPALAQEGEEAASAEVNAGVTVAFLALVIQYLVEWVKTKWASLDGDVTRIVALLLGFGSAYAWDLDVAADFGFEGLPVVLSYVVAAFAIAGVSGVVASAKNAMTTSSNV